MTDTATLAPVLAEYIAAVNAFDEDAIAATFADDTLVNDVHRNSGAARPSAAGWPGNWSATG